MIEQEFYKQLGLEDMIQVKNLWVSACSFEEAGAFVVLHHYTHSVKGMTPAFSFKVSDRASGQMVGAAIFGVPGQVQIEDKYGILLNGPRPHTKEFEPAFKYRLVELRRLVLLDEAPRNSETRVLGIMLQELTKSGVGRVLSYADPNEKREGHPDGQHTGLIYRGACFHKILETRPTKAVWWKGRRYPVRNLDQYNNYHSEPSNWSSIPEDKKILRYEKCKEGKRAVWVIKLPEHRIGIAKELHAALVNDSAHYKEEAGKIGYLKGLTKGDEYFDTPRWKTPATWKGSMQKAPCFCCYRQEKESNDTETVRPNLG